VAKRAYSPIVITPVVPQSVRTQSSFQYLFTLLGPTSVKAVRRTLMKLTPGRHSLDPLSKISVDEIGFGFVIVVLIPPTTMTPYCDVADELSLILEHRWPFRPIHSQSQFHQHFASSFCANVLLQKSHKAKL